MEDDFIKLIKSAADEFLKIDRNSSLRIVSHHDADGICAAAIMVSALLNDDRNYSLSIVPQLTEVQIKKLSKESHPVFLFTDLGSGQIDLLKKYLSGKQVFILDHHEVKSGKTKGDSGDSSSDASADNLDAEQKDEGRDGNIVHINPHLCNIEGASEISGAGVAYLFAKEINQENVGLSYIPLIGAIGDIQENNGFSGLNKKILEDARESKKIDVVQGLRFFGTQTRPLHKVLEYSFDLFIPGVSGSESGAMQFIQEIGIDPKKGTAWKKLDDLSDEEVKTLTTGLVMRRLTEEKPEDIVGPVYILPGETKGGPTRDAREFATLLNACGRLGKASLGIGALVGDREMKLRAIREVNMYKKEIVGALSWVEKNADSEQIRKGDNYLIIDGRNNIRYTLIGTVASILSKSTKYAEGTILLGLADADDGNVKVSIRQSGRSGVNLREVLEQIAEKVDGEIGGHCNAAGAQIKPEKVEGFIDLAEACFKKMLPVSEIKNEKETSNI